MATEDGDGFGTTAGAFQTANKGSQDAVMFKLSAPSVGMTLTSSANPASSRTPTTLTATVSDPNLTGNVFFMDGSSQLGSAPLNGGTAILTTALSAGVHRLTAVYRSNPTTADSALLHLVVNTGLVCN